MKNDIIANQDVEKMEIELAKREIKKKKKMGLHGKSVFKLREIIQQKSGTHIDLKKGEG